MMLVFPSAARSASGMVRLLLGGTNSIKATRRLRLPRRMMSTNDNSDNYPIPMPWMMTKIVCTLGPAVTSPERPLIPELVQNGMAVARLNFSHVGGDYAYLEACQRAVQQAPGKHAERIATHSANKNSPHNLRAILVDTKGPEIRTGPLQGQAKIVSIATGATVELTTRPVGDDPPPVTPAGPHRIQVDYAAIGESAQIGCHILLDDGLLALQVTHISNSTATTTTNVVVTCRALNAGTMQANKGVNMPNTVLQLPALTEQDGRDLAWACANGADYVAASFIRTAEHVRTVKSYLEQQCLQLQQYPSTTATSTTTVAPLLRPLLISKIESKEGVDNFDEILAESDGIMVARGDLGVEIPFDQVFAQQKRMIRACNAVGKPVIVATQMLDSMQRRPRPTRAEVTDVGTAVLDGADAVMLSVCVCVCVFLYCRCGLSLSKGMGALLE
jgi:pyruvate kinase